MNQLDLDGRVAVITGGARGIGLAVARRALDSGASVCLWDVDGARLRQAAAELGDAKRVRTEEIDLRADDQVRAATASTLTAFGRIDVLVNNAGIIQATPWEHATVDDYQQSLAVHFWAPLFAMRAAVPHMIRQGGGRILNISSIGGRVAIPHLNPYGAGKAALLALSDGVRDELAKDGIVITTATPGLMRTGSHVNVDVRGRHKPEAGLFGVMTATPLTAMQGERAARQILEACRRGRSQVTTSWQARTLARANVLAPELTARLLAEATNRLLPGPTSSPEGDMKRRSRDIDVGWVGALWPQAAARRNNEF